MPWMTYSGSGVVASTENGGSRRIKQISRDLRPPAAFAAADAASDELESRDELLCCNVIAMRLPCGRSMIG